LATLFNARRPVFFLNTTLLTALAGVLAALVRFLLTCHTTCYNGVPNMLSTGPIGFSSTPPAAGAFDPAVDLEWCRIMMDDRFKQFLSQNKVAVNAANSR
jgi:hypothetical protein